MQPVLLDTSVYVSVLRQRDVAIAVERFAADTLLWLSAVVLEELYAGARERDWLVVERSDGKEFLERVGFVERNGAMVRKVR